MRCTRLLIPSSSPLLHHHAPAPRLVFPSLTRINHPSRIHVHILTSKRQHEHQRALTPKSRASSCASSSLFKSWVSVPVRGKHDSRHGGSESDGNSNGNSDSNGTRKSASGARLTSWGFEDVNELAHKPQRGRIIIDVREPTELSSTGKIPTAYSMPIVSNPDAIYLPAEEFRARFGFEKPGSSPPSSLPSSSSSSSSAAAAATENPADTDTNTSSRRNENENEEKVQEVVFYCLAGVRSKRAAEMAAGEDGWAGVRIGEWGGGWSEWVAKGGRVER